MLWTTESAVIEYRIQIVVTSREALLTLTLENIDGRPVYLLDTQPWEVSVQGRTVRLDWGNRLFLYGSELPQMRRIQRGETVRYSSRVALPVDLEEINFLVVGYHCICSSERSLDDELRALEAVNGWWQGADVELAEEFLSYLVLEEVTFYNFPLKQ